MSNSVIIENAKIMWRNFSGKAGDYNHEGDRNFCVLLEDDQANMLKTDGFNVKWLEPREEGDVRQAYLPVKVKFTKRPPKIVLVSSSGKSFITEDDINILDWADIDHVDMVVNPYEWNRNGKTGITAYLKDMYVAITEDPFEQKYMNVPDSAQNTVGGCGNCEICSGECHE